MIYFITGNKNTYNNLKEKEPYYPNVEILNTEEGITYFSSWSKDKEVIGFDTETNGLDANSNQVHFWIFGDYETQFVFHNININELTPYLVSKQLLGHNIKFDIKFLYTNTNRKVLHSNIYDTMIAEQRIYMKSGMSFALDSLVARYTGDIPPEMNKTIRDEFINQSVDTFNVQYKHILYGAGDIQYLFPIKDGQEKLIKRYELYNLIYKIEFPLTSIIAKAEVIGFKFNLDKWISIADENIEKRYQIELKLDKLILDIIETLPTERKIMFNKKKLINRPKELLTYEEILKQSGQTNLFGEQTDYTFFTKKKLKTPPKIKSYHFNYGSETQIVELFAKIQEPLLTKTEDLIIPTLTKKGKIDKSVYSFQTNEDALNKYLIKLPNSRMKEFIELIIEHRGLSNSINNFGKNFIDKINPNTGNIHTIFRQASADTGRFQSGGGRNEPDKINAQNIPRNIEMRNCFIARDGYNIGTHDYSGAELIIAAAFSGDQKLYLLGTQGDIHSHVAQTCWRAIYRLRANSYTQQMNNMFQTIGAEVLNEELYPEYKTLQDKYNEYIKLSTTFIVSKTENKNSRTEFKPMLFGVIYGMYSRKAGETLNISKEEGQLVIDIIKKEFPDVFVMVEAASDFAKQFGYIILNQRTKSRAWFPNIIKSLKGVINAEENFMIISKEANEARNIRIQGTQADFMKEATVRLQNWINRNNLQDEITLLSWVHDEIVDEHPKYLDGISDEWKEWSKSNNLQFQSLSGESYNNLSFPEIKALIMEETANQYLSNKITIKTEYTVEPYWTKD